MNNLLNQQQESSERDSSLNTRKFRDSTPKPEHNRIFDLNKVQLFVKKANRISAVPSRSNSRGASLSRKSKKQQDTDKSEQLTSHSNSLHSKNLSYHSNTSQDSEKLDKIERQQKQQNVIDQFQIQSINIKTQPKVPDIIGPSKEEVNLQFQQRWQQPQQQQGKAQYRHAIGQGNYRNLSVQNNRNFNYIQSSEIIKLIQGQQEKQDDEKKTNELSEAQQFTQPQIQETEIIKQEQITPQINNQQMDQLNKVPFEEFLQTKSSSSSLKQLPQKFINNLSTANSSKTNSTPNIRYNNHQIYTEIDSFENLTTNASYSLLYQNSPYYNGQYGNFNQQIPTQIFQDIPNIQQSDSQKYLQQQQQFQEQKINVNYNNNFTPRQRGKQEVKQEESILYNIDLNNIEFDGRTTLMIKNIPNKYTQNMILQQINQNFCSLYDFFYLPIDHTNKCNVGYAFINFIDTKSIKPFVLEFDNQRWNKFNSEKICEIRYARIQGKDQLNQHFQNSSVMNQKDKKCKPIFIDNKEKQKIRYILEKQKRFFNDQ